MRSLCLLSLFLVIVGGKGAKILFATMPQGRSHIWGMLPLAHRLLQDNHEVTVMFEIFKPELPFGEGIKDHLIMWKDIDPSVINLFDQAHPLWLQLLWGGDYTSDTLILAWTAAVRSLEHILKNQFNDFAAIANQNWDLIIVDPLFANSGMTIALLHKNHTPYMHFFTAQIDPLHTYFKGVGRSLAASPTTTLVARPDYAGWSAEKLFDRFRAAKDSVHFGKIYLYHIEEMVRNSMSSVISKFSFKQWIKDDSLSFYEYFDRFDWALPRARDFVHVGAHCDDIRQRKTLPIDIENFVNDPHSKGTILITFGTIVRWDLAPNKTIQTMLDAMRELKEYRILWSYRGPKLDWSQNVMAAEWLPQLAILNHSKTRLVMTHGGLKRYAMCKMCNRIGAEKTMHHTRFMNIGAVLSAPSLTYLSTYINVLYVNFSLKESICAVVPLLFMPMFAEQVRNSYLAQTMGIGLLINKKTVTVKSIVDSIRELTTNEIYYSKVRRIKTIWLDRIIPSVDEGAFWVNKTIKYKGLPKNYFKIKPIDSMLEYLFIDLFIVLYATVITCTVI